MEHLNTIDYILIAIFFVSTLAGLLRGFMNEIISILVWLTAFVVAFTFAKPVALAFTHPSTSASATSQSISALAIGLSFLGLFITTFVIGSLIHYIITKTTQYQGIGLLNRFLGALFGFGRGFLINLILIFLIQFTTLTHQPLWAQSQLILAYQPAIQWLNTLTRPHVENLKITVDQEMYKFKPPSKESPTPASTAEH